MQKMLDLLVQFDGGANTRDFSDNLNKNESTFPVNVDTVGLTVQKTPGYTLFGTEPDASTIGRTLYNHRILSETEVMIKTIGTSVKFYDEISGIFYPIATGLTTGLRWWFATFNGYLYGGNGTDNLCRWKGSAWGALANPVTGASTTIDLGTGEGARFDTSGSGFIEGDTFAWSGKSTDQLTGVTGLSANHATGSRVITAMDTSTYSTQPKGKMGVFYQNRLWIVDATSPNFLYFSKLADASNPHDDLVNFTIAGTGTGDAGYLIFPAPVLGLRIFITGENNAVLLAWCADSIIYACSVTDSGSTTVGTNVPFKVFDTDLVSSHMHTITENDVLFIDNLGQMRALGYGDSSTVIKTQRLSDKIEPTMALIDFSDGAMIYHDRRAYAIGKIEGAEHNNFTVVWNTDPASFVFYTHWQMNDFVEWKNELYGLSSMNGNVYKLRDGYNAGSNGIPILTQYPMGDSQLGYPLILKSLYGIRMTGFISENCELIAKIYFDGRTEFAYEFTLSGSDTNIISSSGNVSIGTVVFGRGIFGGVLFDGQIRREFFAELVFPSEEYVRTMRIEFENNQADVDFALNKLIPLGGPQDPNLVKDANYLSSN